MAQYLVDVEIRGRVRVEADSPVEAVEAAEQMTPELSDQKVFGAVVEGSNAEPVQSTKLEPKSLIQVQSVIG